MPVMAPTGQALTHCPQNVQDVSASGIMLAVPTFAEKPRPTPVRVPTVWTLLQTVSQRRHMMHLERSRMMASLESSIGKWLTSPLNSMSLMPNSAASFWSSQSWFLGQVRQFFGWSESISSRTVRRALRARCELVQTSTRSLVIGVAQAGTSTGRGRMPAASTRHMRQDAGLLETPQPRSLQ